MISVAEAQALCLGLVRPIGTEDVPLEQAAGRTLRQDVRTWRPQPPFPSAAMDGYAVRDAEVRIGATFTVIGESAAGHGFAGDVGHGQAVRIFTGAPVPPGADHVVIQEDVTRADDLITIQPSLGDGPNIRPLGVDFGPDFSLAAPRVLSPYDCGLLAAMNCPSVTVSRRPRVGILATGDELVMPGGTPNADQILSSNVFALKSMVDAAGGEGVILPIAPDTRDGLRTAMASLAEFDIAITVGGASVGDYDLVGQISGELGLERAFYKITMRPGKPLIAGAFSNGQPYLGLPGNPVSAIVCGVLFLIPMLRKMLGQTEVLPQTQTAVLAVDTGPNGPRTHYMRARVEHGHVTPAQDQDSSLLSVLASSNCLMIRPIKDPARKAGDIMEILPL